MGPGEIRALDEGLLLGGRVEARWHKEGVALLDLRPKRQVHVVEPVQQVLVADVQVAAGRGTREDNGGPVLQRVLPDVFLNEVEVLLQKGFLVVLQ